MRKHFFTIPLFFIFIIPFILPFKADALNINEEVKTKIIEITNIQYPTVIKYYWVDEEISIENFNINDIENGLIGFFIYVNKSRFSLVKIYKRGEIYSYIKNITINAIF